MPFSSAAAIVYALNVDPAWKPSSPPIDGSTERFQKVSPFFARGPITGRLCAMAMIKPVPGWIMFMVEITGSFGPTTALTRRWARFWVFGSMAVSITSPPRLTMFFRSLTVLPRLGVCSSDR